MSDVTEAGTIQELPRRSISNLFSGGIKLCFMEKKFPNFSILLDFVTVTSF